MENKIKLISDILNLSLAKEDHEETVQKRWDYIQEQLGKDPNWVGYDHAECYNGRVDLLNIFPGYIIGTNGEMYKLIDKENYKVLKNNLSSYTSKTIKNISGEKKIKFYFIVLLPVPLFQDLNSIKIHLIIS